MTNAATGRRRLPKGERRAQLLAEARNLIREIGTDGLTLGRLAERAGVAKPLVYDHFGDRAGLLAGLYREFGERQHEMLDAALLGAEADLRSVAEVVATAYIDCCLAEGRELTDVLAALAGSPTLDRVRVEAEDAYLAKCRRALTPFAGEIDAAGLRAIIGAGNALARAAITAEIGAERARAMFASVIVAVAQIGVDQTSPDSE